jgi:predicted dehydrogenase
VESQRDPFAYRRILKELPRPACAIVVVPDHLHTPIAADVIRAGVHPLVVKPLTRSVREARELIELAENCNVYGAVEFHKRFDEANLVLRQTIANGRLGDLRYITVEYSQRRLIRRTFQSWIRHTNVFQYLGVHYVDLIYFITGARPVRVLATGQPSIGVTEDLSSLDAIQALVEWKLQGSEESFISTLVTNWIDAEASSAMSDQRITVVGTSGRFQSDQKNRGVQVVTDQGVEDVNPYFTQCYADATGDFTVRGYGPRSIRQFLTDVRDLSEGRRDLRELASNRPSFQQGLVSTAVIEAVNRSLSRGGDWVAIGREALPSSNKVGLFPRTGSM